MEARGEVRGGRFVAGFSGEQFGLPDAVDALRRMNKSPNNNEIVVISGTDPLNLAGVITPGVRISTTTKNQIAYLDGEPVAVRIGQDFRMLKECTNGVELRVRTALIRQRRPTNRRSSSRR
jgi:ATP-dependent helicase Lhr and Lhr-like helicase